MLSNLCLQLFTGNPQDFAIFFFFVHRNLWRFTKILSNRKFLFTDFHGPNDGGPTPDGTICEFECTFRNMMQCQRNLVQFGIMSSF